MGTPKPLRTHDAVAKIRLGSTVKMAHITNPVLSAADESFSCSGTIRAPSEGPIGGIELNMKSSLPPSFRRSTQPWNKQ
jgi:hypothetical protein